MLTILAQKSRKYRLWRRLEALQRAQAVPSQYYFAYGANVQSERFRDNRMVFEQVGPACLPNHRLDFSLKSNRVGMGYASVSESAGDEVWGVLYKMHETSLELLDVLEWVNYGYYRRVALPVVWQNGEESKTVETWVYVATHPKSGLVPATEYLAKMVGAGRAFGYPERYLEHIQNCDHRPFLEFPLDHGFRIAKPEVSRPFVKALAPVYSRHDELRQKLMTRLP